MKSLSRQVMLSGSFGSGKTRVLCMKGVFLSQLYPGNRGLIVRKNFNTLEKSTLWTLLKPEGDLPPVLPPEMIISHHKTKHIIEVQTNNPRKPSYIFYEGLDDPDKLGSFVNLGWIGIDEGTETEEGDWSQLMGRLRHNKVPFHQIFTATNPDSPDHYLYKKFYDENGEPRTDLVAHCIESNSLMNPYLPAEYIKALQELKGQFYERYVLGKWVGFGGQIYDVWDRKINEIPRFEIPGHWDRIRSIDFGFVHPFVCQWWAIAPESFYYTASDGVNRHIPAGCAVMYREIYKTRELVSDMATLIKRETGNEQIIASVADWDAEGRETLDANGIVTSPAIKDVEAGIQACYRRIRVDFSHTHPAPMLLIMKDARCHAPDQYLVDKQRPLCTADEIPLYRRYDTQAKEDNPKRKEQPIKKGDDGCDAMRYGIVAIENLEVYKPFKVKMRVMR